MGYKPPKSELEVIDKFAGYPDCYPVQDMIDAFSCLVHCNSLEYSYIQALKLGIGLVGMDKEKLL